MIKLIFNFPQNDTAAAKAATKAPTAANDPAGKDDGGCKSTAIGGLAVISLISGAAWILFRKRKHCAYALCFRFQANRGKGSLFQTTLSPLEHPN